MKFLAQTHLLILGVVIVTNIGASDLIGACVDFKRPQTHFDGVNEYGFVSYWDQIGALDAGNGVTLPLIIGFRSDWERSSPYLGYGWMLGILDSHFVQRDPNAFDMIQPDGYTVPFGRDLKDSAILNGAKGWKAEIKTDSIVAYASCGWKLTFVKGKLSQISLPDNRILEVRRDSKGIATDIVLGSSVLLKVEKDSKGVVSGLLLGDKRIGLEPAEKPRVQIVHGNNLISAKDFGVGKITFPDHSVTIFDYGLDEAMRPTIKITAAGEAIPRMITWDPATQLILSDGKWNYQVEPSDQPGHNASIQRTTAAGKRELWHFDSARGVERNLTEDGKLITKTWFTSGTLSGKPRSKEIATADGKKENYRRIYDEKGILAREMKNGQLYRTFLYNENGQLSKILYSDQSATEFVRKGDKVHRRFLSREGTLIRELASAAKPQSIQKQ